MDFVEVIRRLLEEVIGLISDLLYWMAISAVGWAEILKIATASGLTTYDSTYLWLSKKLEGKLTTADEELRRRGEIITKTVLLGELGSFLKGSIFMPPA